MPPPSGDAGAAAPVTVLVPVYNESATIDEILRRVAANPIVGQIVVVDDASTDGTRDKLQALQADPSRVLGRSGVGLSLILHARNRGKGAALRTAIPRAEGRVCIVQDADLIYPGQQLHLK